MRKTRRHVHFFSALLFSLSLLSSSSVVFLRSFCARAFCWFVIDCRARKIGLGCRYRNGRKIFLFFCSLGDFFFFKTSTPHFYIQLSLSVSSFVCLSVRLSVCLFCCTLVAPEENEESFAQTSGGLAFSVFVCVVRERGEFERERGEFFFFFSPAGGFLSRKTCVLSS